MARFEDKTASKISGAKALKFFGEIRLRTPESVELEFPLAGIGSKLKLGKRKYIFGGSLFSLFTSRNSVNISIWGE